MFYLDFVRARVLHVNRVIWGSKYLEQSRSINEKSKGSGRPPDHRVSFFTILNNLLYATVRLFRDHFETAEP